MASKKQKIDELKLVTFIFENVGLGLKLIVLGPDSFIFMTNRIRLNIL